MAKKDLLEKGLDQAKSGMNTSEAPQSHQLVTTPTPGTGNDSNTTGNTSPSPKSDTVTVSRNQLDAYIADAVAKAVGAKVDKPKRVTNHTAVVRYHNGQPVVGLGNLVERKVEGRTIGYIKLTLLDGTVEEVEYLKFLNESERQQVSIISQKATEHVTNGNQGRTIHAENPNPYEVKNWQSTQIDLDVVSYTYKATVKVLQDGDHLDEEFEIETAYLNI